MFIENFAAFQSDQRLSLHGFFNEHFPKQSKSKKNIPTKQCLTCTIILFSKVYPERETNNFSTKWSKGKSSWIWVLRVREKKSEWKGEWNVYNAIEQLLTKYEVNEFTNWIFHLLIMILLSFYLALLLYTCIRPFAVVILLIFFYIYFYRIFAMFYWIMR